MGKKTFNLTKIVEKTFNIVVEGLTITATWILNFSQKSVITFVTKMSQYLTLGISNKISLSFIASFTEYPIASISNKINVNTALSQLQYLTITKSSSLTSEFILHQRIRNQASITGFNFVTSFSPILAQFYSLGDWDSSTLGSLDSKTLGELDYQVV